jgi:8-oxo-dGTP pyrophosphatase MutT (NUDIX family)
MIFKKQPDNFIPKMEVVGCFLENDGEFLILQRHDNKPQGNTWGLPSGKL